MYNINTEFEQTLETAALEFLEKKDIYTEIISIHHTDADGYASGAIIRNMIQRLKLPLRQLPYNLSKPWDEFLFAAIGEKEGPRALFLSDLGPDGALLLKINEKYLDLDIFILDHHIFRGDPKSLPENYYNCNPTQFGLNGLKEIAGATTNYLFACYVDEKNRDLGWLAAIGMGGDTLEHFNNYQSYNRAVCDEAIEHGLIEKKKGLCLFGGQYEHISKALTLSILPFIPPIKGDLSAAKEFLDSLNIPPKTKIEDLTMDQVNSIAEALENESLIGEYLLLPKKQGLLRYIFEHAQIVSLVGHDHPHQANSFLNSNKVNKEAKQSYIKFMTTLVRNLTTFVSIPKQESSNCMIVDLTNAIPINMWSDTGSFATINGIYNPLQCLFIGGLDGDTMKLSVRCSGEFLEVHHGFGANTIIAKLVESLGGQGGGHPLAGGYRIPPKDFTKLLSTAESIIKKL